MQVEFLGQPERKPELGAAGGEDVRTEGLVGDDVARADAGGVETADRLATDEEAVFDTDVVTEQTEDMAGRARKSPRPILRDRVEHRGLDAVAHKLHVTPDAGKVLVQSGDIALGRVDTTIPDIVAEPLTDDRAHPRALLLANET